MDYKNFKLLEFKAEKGEGSAIIAELNKIDLDGDVTIPGAFGTQHVNLMGAHDTHSPRLGKAVLTEKDGKAIAEFKFNLDPDAIRAKEWYSSLKFDQKNGVPLQEWSYGFKVEDSDFGEFEGKSVRFLKKMRVFEVSPVMRGAGIGTGTISIKSNDGLTFKEELEKALISLADVKAFVDRAKSLADLRAKKGKELSGEYREQLESLKCQLVGIENDLSGLLIDQKAEALTFSGIFAQYEKIKFENRHLIGGIR